LLVEVAVGGVMASVILGALLVNIGGAHDRTTIIARQMTARMLAEQGIEQIRSKGLAGTSSSVAAVPTTLTGTYTRTCTTSNTSTTVNGLALGSLSISCTVTFPINADGRGTTGIKSVTLSTQITEPP
jgi:hypothetical protein